MKEIPNHRRANQKAAWAETQVFYSFTQLSSLLRAK